MNDPGNFFIEYTIMNVRFFGVKVFIKGSPYNAIRVDGYSKFFSDLANVRIISTLI
jgi:hypothetical protein